LLSLDAAKHKADMLFVTSSLVDDPRAVEKAADFYPPKTREMLDVKSYELPGVSGQRIDVVVRSEYYLYCMLYGMTDRVYPSG
jgi:hypothetical protein